MARDGKQVLSNIVASQTAAHSKYGGVVPEIACRKHIENIVWVVRKALSDCACTFEDLDAIAVTYGPGLVGALLVGIGMAKAISYSRDLPLIPVNHLEGHVLSFLAIPDAAVEFPFVSLVVSGGHTSLFVVRALGEYRLVGQTVDDAAGEAFDKVARALELGYPGGPQIEALSKECAGDYIDFPSPMLKHDSYDFSFSGLKTAVLNYLKFEQDITSPDEVASRIPRQALARIAGGFQRAVVNVLIQKTLRLTSQENVRLVCLGGGVAANGVLRDMFSHAAEETRVRVICPPRELCTDNAAMIACAAHHHFLRGDCSGLDLDACPNLSL